jgi:hypothetical protein
MPLFGFSDITFDKGTESRRGPLGKLVGSDFEQTTLRYPIDLGNYDKSHYVVFYIKQQRHTAFGRTEAKNEFSAPDQILEGARGASKAARNISGEITNKINSGLGQINQATGGVLSGATSAIGKVVGNVSGTINNLFGGQSSTITGNSQASSRVIDNSIKRITGGSLSFLRTTTLTTDAIALYMPDTLNYSYSQTYDSAAIGGEIGGKVLAAGKSAVDSFNEDGSVKAGSTLAKAVGGAVLQGAARAAAGQTGDLLFTAATGTVSNPMLEMIYKSPNFRTFQFDFTFYPRDEKEAFEVQRIIERVRFHQAPELASAQNFLIPPSEFDIKFYYGGKENPNIPQIATCVLTTIDVNYAPNGFAAYEVPNENFPSLGRTGMPVAIQLVLQFQEVTFLTKKDFRSDDEFENKTNTSSSRDTDRN